MVKIDRIEVEGFRGITRACTLPLNGKSLLLFGENGTGKSSFVDALERLFTGKVSTLEGRMGVSTERHGPNIRIPATAENDAVSLVTTDHTDFDPIDRSGILRIEWLR